MAHKPSRACREGVRNLDINSSGPDSPIQSYESVGEYVLIFARRLAAKIFGSSIDSGRRKFFFPAHENTSGS
jgi:hypothetical protein